MKRPKNLEWEEDLNPDSPFRSTVSCWACWQKLSYLHWERKIQSLYNYYLHLGGHASIDWFCQQENLEEFLWLFCPPTCPSLTQSRWVQLSASVCSSLSQLHPHWQVSTQTSKSVSARTESAWWQDSWLRLSSFSSTMETALFHPLNHLADTYLLKKKIQTS